MKALLIGYSIAFSALVWICSTHAFTVVPTGRITKCHPSRAHATSLAAQSGGYHPFHQPTTESQQQEADRRQLLGMPAATAASDSTPLWKIRLQLTKPVTWIPLAAGVMCGAAASGNYHWIWNPLHDPNDRDMLLGVEDAAKGLVTMILAGPFMEGYSQTINDWYDKDIDAINEPYRPIPSGVISEAQVWQQILFLALGSIGISFGVDVWAQHEFPTVLVCALIGTLVGYIYSAPPLRLKQNGWSGDVAIGLCYITLPWWCGHAAFGELNRLEFWLL
jgi:chlorophyll synthase